MGRVLVRVEAKVVSEEVNPTLPVPVLPNLLLSTARKPSEVTDVRWIVASLRGSTYPVHTWRGGKWLVFAPKEDVDEVWVGIVAALEVGEFGDIAKVSTARPSQYATSTQEEVVCVYTYDGDDVDDVWRVREALRRLGFKQKLGWKSDQATREGRYESLGHVDVNRYEG